MAEPFDAVVLAGGQSSRLGGADKTALLLDGRTLLDTVLAAVAGAGTRIVVGPARPTATPATFTRERPPGGGPAAAVPAGLALVRAQWVAVLAGDLPWLDAVTVDALRAAAANGGGGGAVLADDTGRLQWLAGVWRTAALRRLPWQPGARLGRLLEPLAPVPVRCPGERPPWFDVDTPADLAHLKGRT